MWLEARTARVCGVFLSVMVESAHPLDGSSCDGTCAGMVLGRMWGWIL